MPQGEEWDKAEIHVSESLEKFGEVQKSHRTPSA